MLISFFNFLYHHPQVEGEQGGGEGLERLGKAAEPGEGPVERPQRPLQARRGHRSHLPSQRLPLFHRYGACLSGAERRLSGSRRPHRCGASRLGVRSAIPWPGNRAVL